MYPDNNETFGSYKMKLNILFELGNKDIKEWLALGGFVLCFSILTIAGLLYYVW